MTRDSVDFVRQGALIALGMVLVQQSEASSPSLASIRALYAKIVSDKHDDPMARFGAALGQGLIDAGGRNVTISLQSRAGSRNTAAIVGGVLGTIAGLALLAGLFMLWRTRRIRRSQEQFLQSRPMSYSGPLKESALPLSSAGACECYS